ncbi:response regulator transcription factor [Mangrovibacter plantisponsor]|uniref:Phosphate regulon transcriptional regulatory protein PhoB n=1 Tax=Mangrovibacter plantisponsor TaxID=451513 RepID=A0A317PYG3_9ENTR|nr:response regulator transcription factor [Mangrovibacter plantisponsor]PWW07730.1 winged helix family two component transcriptional regulator [Mangrovibacter plantisponsor]
MSETRRVLVIEDDPHIARLLQLHLRNAGYETTLATEGARGVQLLNRGGWDALILDLMLPEVDGLEICRQARTQARYMPIIIVSARTGETERIQGLNLGADDYVTKPFSAPELLARLNALFRRQQAMSDTLKRDAGVLHFAGLSVDPLSRHAILNEQVLDLTPREFDLLYFFARHPGEIFSRLDLLIQVWGYQHEGYEHTVNTHINRLRIKLETDPSQPQLIVTVWGQGYKFLPPGSEG